MAAAERSAENEENPTATKNEDDDDDEEEYYMFNACKLYNVYCVVCQYVLCERKPKQIELQACETSESTNNETKKK